MATLLEQLFDDSNIYKAIYSLESYVFEKELLDDKDIELFKELSDKYNTSRIESVIKSCKAILVEKFEKEELFKIEVFFKPKKYDKVKNEEVYRPMHTADLKTQICLVSMLNLIMFDDSDGTRKLSDICKLIPSNFYGNIPSLDVSLIFKSWARQYSEYSKNILSANKEYSLNRKYSKEVNLDLKGFYPSIDPVYIYTFIWNKVSAFYNSDDQETLKKILKKLLFFEINFDDAINDIDFYYKDLPKAAFSKIRKQGKFFNIGIPQGLPQAYLFGNFCMIEVAKIISGKFDGDAYYYVDDSVIYTNNKKEEFTEAVESINSNLRIISGDGGKLVLPDSLKHFYEWTKILYNINIHPAKDDSKTKIYDIGTKDCLFELARPASATTFEIKATFDDLEDETLRRKLVTLLDYINYKLEEIEKEDDKEQKTLLQRYKKFYSYRLKILEYRQDNKIDTSTINTFADDYGLSPFDKLKFFNKLEDDIFIREAQMLLKYTIYDLNLQNQILDNIKNFENGLDQKFINNYFSKSLCQYKQFILNEDLQYRSLDSYSKKVVPPYLKSNSQERNEKIKGYLKLFDPFGFSLYKIGFYKFIYENSTEFKRKLYNALYSYVLNVPIQDGCNLMKMNGRAIHYYELRLLMYLRLNYKFDDNYFRQFAQNIFNELQNNEEKVDLALFEVLPLLKKYIREPKQIDDLILTHRFVNGIWKNGSKFLHFYTLHNEEHSIELIKYCTRITKSIDYLSIKNLDYYLLFLTCYLHDVSMVLYPNLDDFNKVDNTEIQLVVDSLKSDFKNNIERIDVAEFSSISKFILDSFNAINTYFENNIRSNHPKNSARFIKNQNDLKFIEILTRQLVANISEGHGFDAKDIYGLKSNAKNDIISEKYLMVIFRLADLLDMSKDRVSINVLKQSIKHMPKESKFQWISHMAIDKCTIETDYKRDKDEIRENVIIKIQLNTRQLTSIKNQKCESLKCDLAEKNAIEITINPEGGEPCNNCNFMSKWMKIKHEYLFKELQSLQKYLERNSENTIFKTSFKVILDLKNTNKLAPEFIDIINLHIN